MSKKPYSPDLERALNCILEGDHYNLTMIAGDGDQTLTVQRGDNVKLFKAALTRLLNKMDDECDYNEIEAVRVVNDIVEEVSYDWLIEVNPDRRKLPTLKEKSNENDNKRTTQTYL